MEPEQVNQENYTNRHKIIIGIIVVVIIILFGMLLLGHSKTSNTNTLTANPKPTKPAGQTLITFSPNPLLLTQNTSGRQTVNLLVNTQGNKIYGADIELTYDPSVLQNLTVQQGTFLPNATLLKSNPVDIANGKISYMIAVSPKQGPIEGTGTLMSISFVPNLLKLQIDKQTGISFLPGTAISASGDRSSALQIAVSEKIRYQK